MIWFVNDRHAYLVNPIWLQSWCKHRSHRSVFMPWCVHGMWESDTFLVFSVFLICGTYPTSDISSLEAPWGVRDCHRGRMWAALCCLECGFLRREGAAKELGRRGGEVNSLYFTPTSSLASCTCLPPMVVAHASLS